MVLPFKLIENYSLKANLSFLMIPGIGSFLLGPSYGSQFASGSFWTGGTPEAFWSSGALGAGNVEGTKCLGARCCIRIKHFL